MVSVLAFNSNDLSSNPADVNNFSVEFVLEKNENKQKRGPFLRMLPDLAKITTLGQNVKSIGQLSVHVIGFWQNFVLWQFFTI